MGPEELREFPFLQRIAANAGQCYDGCILSELALKREQDGVDLDDIEGVEQCLKTLQEAGRTTDDLAEQVADLLGRQRSDWDKARTELLGLSLFETRRVLASIGWPLGVGGRNRPFDALLGVNGQEVAVDIKSAANSGLALLRRALSPVVAAWSKARALGAVGFSLHLQRDITQRQLGQQLRALADSLTQQLNGCLELPTEDIALNAEDCHVRVQFHSGSDLTASSTVSGSARTRSIAALIRDHAEHKSEQITDRGTSFLLAYVRPAGSGAADISSAVLEDASLDLFNETSANLPDFLGVLLIDCSVSPIQIRGRHRRNVASSHQIDWPQVVQKLGITEYR